MKLSRTINSWFRTRLYQRLWWSLPAIVFGVAWVVFGLTFFFMNPASTHRKYSVAVTRSLASKDYKTMRVAAQRLLLSWPADSRAENQYDLALALLGLGQRPEAAALLNLVAPLDKPGYAPAHMFAARYLLSLTNLTAQGARQAEAQLNNALEIEPESVEAHEMLGRLYFQEGNWDDAKTQLQTVVAARPDDALMLAVIARRAGDDQGVRHWTGAAVDYYRDKLGKTLVDDTSARLNWSQALTLQENFADAVQVLQDGQKLSGAPAYAPALAEIYAYWAAQIVRDHPTDLASRFKLIEQGLRYNQKDVRLLDLLLALSHLSGQDAKDAEATFNKLLAAGDSSAMLHLLLGNDAAQRGDQEQARYHFGLAFALSPDLPGVANNLALLLILTKEPDLPRALAIIQPLVEKFPLQPDFHNTRGQIYVKMGRYEDAVKDLEFALPAVLDKTPTHKALAEAYGHLGMTDLADEHARLAGEIRNPAAVFGDKKH